MGGTETGDEAGNEAGTEAWLNIFCCFVSVCILLATGVVNEVLGFGGIFLLLALFAGTSLTTNMFIVSTLRS